ncbi:unnamed protein product [Symbiodinium microadriaticum]|nr:unnamed protein product [Symbiodinium microadriaticum]
MAAAQARRILGLVFEIEHAAGTVATPAELGALSMRRKGPAVQVLSGQPREQDNGRGGRGKLQYCAGFFDGLGHVFEDGPSYRLELTLPWEQHEALRLFQQLFGGSIVPSEAVGARRLLELRGRPLHVKGNLKWQLRGEPGRSAAFALAAQAVLKQPQLLLAAHWPFFTSSPRAALEGCKWMGPFSRAEITWAYVAGLFDAVGHIRDSGSNRQVFLEFKQKSFRLLESLQGFLKNQLSLSSEFVSVRHFHRFSRLSVVDSRIAHATLRQLLRVGLILRKEAAQLALSPFVPEIPKLPLGLILAARRSFVDECGPGRRRLLPLSQSLAKHEEAFGRQSDAADARHDHCNSETWSLQVGTLRTTERHCPPSWSRRCSQTSQTTAEPALWETRHRR